MSSQLELIQCEEALLEEITDKGMRQKDVAQTYALAMRSSDEPDWSVVNQAIIKRWSRSGLERIKRMAWDGSCFPSYVKQAPQVKWHKGES